MSRPASSVWITPPRPRYPAYGTVLDDAGAFPLAWFARLRSLHNRPPRRPPLGLARGLAEVDRRAAAETATRPRPPELESR